MSNTKFPISFALIFRHRSAGSPDGGAIPVESAHTQPIMSPITSRVDGTKRRVGARRQSVRSAAHAILPFTLDAFAPFPLRQTEPVVPHHVITWLWTTLSLVRTPFCAFMPVTMDAIVLPRHLLVMNSATFQKSMPATGNYVVELILLAFMLVIGMVAVYLNSSRTVNTVTPARKPVTRQTKAKKPSPPSPSTKQNKTSNRKVVDKCQTPQRPAPAPPRKKAPPYHNASPTTSSSSSRKHPSNRPASLQNSSKTNVVLTAKKEDAPQTVMSGAKTVPERNQSCSKKQPKENVMKKVTQPVPKRKPAPAPLLEKRKPKENRPPTLVVMIPLAPPRPKRSNHFEAYRALRQVVIPDHKLFEYGYPFVMPHIPSYGYFYNTFPYLITSVTDYLPVYDQQQQFVGVREPEMFWVRCSRCRQNFHKYQNGQCVFHAGKVGNGGKLSCCNESMDSAGCSMASQHVWSGIRPGLNGPISGFVYAKQSYNMPKYIALIIDCEMCYTANGLELAQITVLDWDGQIVYSTYVRPGTQIIDYNTRFSGVTEEKLRRGPTKFLTNVQSDLLSLIDVDTILIGHGLENDLRALKLVHSKIIDTSVLYGFDTSTYLRRISLKQLTSNILHRTIQESPLGHSSVDDAQACLELTKEYISKRKQM